jgi:hypothetical protein
VGRACVPFGRERRGQNAAAPNNHRAADAEAAPAGLQRCDCVFAIIDTASKTGTENDGTAVTFFPRDRYGGRQRLIILDWDIVQIEGALLVTWLPLVFAQLEQLSQICQARFGSIGAVIEDKNSGTIFLQQALRRLQVDVTSEGRASDLSVWIRLSRRGKIQRPCLQQGQCLQTSITKSPRGSGRKLSAGRQEQQVRGRSPYGIALSLGDDKGF